jgi:DNA-directed RNA polymerase subunit RPC12/RpoP
MSEPVICPACGSEKVSRIEKEELGHLTLGSDFTYKAVIYKCSTCSEEGDFFAESDKDYLLTQREAQINLVKHMIEDLNNKGISMASFERILELPARTLTRWKNGNFSSSAIALLRIAITYPWILETANHKFESSLDTPF